ncbi:VanW family protein [Nonomuraea angiospora]|uniref:Vancomycin resistance protein YoaR n=1 Tax=Nonomuraea angiospora TaxID=46172 RepID=A0ABR9MM31_9ACTN|nr:VanW family protein [Nonomuraea angiospora]MBE1593517.1 vancomycin resistance protein YoaR [Nonomuraea angiospora]
MSAPRSRRVLIVTAAVVLVAVLGYAVPAIALSGKVPPGTRVDGVDIGGLAPESARSHLDRQLAQRVRRPMMLVAGGKRVQLSPAELGLDFDARATVEAAMAGAATPAGIVRSLFGSRQLPPRVIVDEQRLATGLAGLAKSVDTKPVQGGVRYQGLEPRAVLPKPGRALDRDAAAQAVRAAFAAGRDSVELKLQVAPPALTAAQVKEVATSTARTAVASPLTLASGGKQATVSREQLAAGLRFVADGKGGLRPSYDAGKIAADMAKSLLITPPKDASFTIVKGKPKVVPSKTGHGADIKALGPAIAGAVAAGSRRVDLPATARQPRVTTAEAAELGVKEQVSSFTTQYPCCAPRVTNIHTIADIVDGYVVQPGETFSLNDVVGKRDKARGFVEAPMILNNRFVNDVGGGVSQFATTMFNAVFFGGFQDVQHRAHQYYITRYPAGRESTVSYPQPDFRWRNDSRYGVLIKTSYTSTSVTVQFWSTKRYEIESQSSDRYNVKPVETITEKGEDCIPMGGSEGFAIDVWRIFKKDGKVVRKQRFHTVYDPEPRLTCEK